MQNKVNERMSEMELKQQEKQLKISLVLDQASRVLSEKQLKTKSALQMHQKRANDLIQMAAKDKKVMIQNLLENTPSKIKVSPAPKVPSSKTFKGSNSAVSMNQMKKPLGSEYGSTSVGKPLGGLPILDKKEVTSASSQIASLRRRQKNIYDNPNAFASLSNETKQPTQLRLID